WADVVLVRGDDGVEEAGLQDALLGEQLLERLGAQLDGRERGGMVVIVVVVRAHAGSNQRSQRSTWTVSRTPAASPHSSRAADPTPYPGSSPARSACAATSGTANAPSCRTTAPRLPRTYRGQRVWPSGCSVTTRTAEPIANRGAADAAGIGGGSGGGRRANGEPPPPRASAAPGGGTPRSDHHPAPPHRPRAR